MSERHFTVIITSGWMIPCYILSQTTSVTRDCIPVLTAWICLRSTTPCSVSLARITGLYTKENICFLSSITMMSPELQAFCQMKIICLWSMLSPLVCRVSHAFIMAVNGVQKPAKKRAILHCVPALRNRNGMISQLLFPNWQRQKNIPMHWITVISVPFFWPTASVFSSEKQILNVFL